MESPKIRRAEFKDACDIARVRITGWRQSYRGIIPEALLAKLDIDADKARVEEALADPDNKSLRFVAELDGQVIGMGACGKARNTDDRKRGEVYAIYLLDEAKGKGTGRSFMREMAAALAAQGYQSLQVCVLEKNIPARKFYEALGGRQSHAGVFKYEGVELPDVTYMWDDIKALAQG